MNIDFSIETEIDKIQNKNTKIYFNEVYQTFVNGNYRAAVVMLYSVLICDLVYKLRDLRDIYNDTKAKKIIDDIEGLQKKNPTSPDWETKLIERIKKDTNLLESSDIVAIESLQKYRHLSAHPILTNSDLLFTPNKDTVKSLMRNILSGVLTNPPFFSNKIFETFLLDISDIKDKMKYKDLKKYLTSKYLKQIKELDFSKLFRSLWKVVFITDNKESQDNREINFQALRTLMEHKRDLCISSIREEPNFYSNITKPDLLSLLCVFLCKFPNVYGTINTPLTTLLINHINQKDNLKITCWFINESFEKHIDELNKQKDITITRESAEILKDAAESNSCLAKFIDFLIDYFGKSQSFKDAGFRFELVSLIINDLNVEQTKTLLTVSNTNPQIYGSYSVSKEEFIRIAEKSKIDKTKYDKIF